MGYGCDNLKTNFLFKGWFLPVYQVLGFVFFLSFVLVSVVEANEATDTDVAKGKLIAEELCSGCHAVSKQGESPFDQAPPFRDVVAKWPVETLAEALAEGIVVGHEAMPEFQFGPEALGHILAYLSTLSDDQATTK